MYANMISVTTFTPLQEGCLNRLYPVAFEIKVRFIVIIYRRFIDDITSFVDVINRVKRSTLYAISWILSHLINISQIYLGKYGKTWKR